MDWITTANGLIALLTALVSLIGAGVGAFFAIKNWIEATKEKNSKEIWNMIIATADTAMKEFEHSSLNGKDKKEAVINSVKEGCKAAGINLDPFIDQLSAYIEQSIAWFNGMKA